MKKIAMIICLFAISATSVVFAQTSKLSKLILELETAVKWEAVEKTWAPRRDSWIKEVSASTTSQQLGKLLSEFETNITWAAVDKAKWEPRRPKWTAEVIAAKTNAEVAKLMVELETNTKWEGVQETWKKARPIWVKEAALIK